MGDDDVPGVAQALRMATVGGARTTSWRDSLGTLELGKGADLSLIDWDSIAYPYLDELTPTRDALVQRAKTSAVRAVMCDGEVIYQEGRCTRVDRDSALKALLPHAERFYADYIDPAQHEPF